MEFYKNLSPESLVTEYEGVTYVEEWLPIDGVKGYEISSFGRIRRLGRWISTGEWRPAKILKLSAGDKYLKISIQGKHFSIHRLVCTLFNENPLSKPQVNHIDTNKYNNFFKNLEWCTQSENNKHAVENDRCWQGSVAHISFADREYIRQHFLTADRNALAAQFGLTGDQLYTIGTNRDTTFQSSISLRAMGVKRRRPVNAQAKKTVVNIETGLLYTTNEVAELLDTTVNYLRKMLNGQRCNRTPYRFVGKEYAFKPPVMRKV